MPFTFSHPAIVLPLIYLPKKRISLTGLVIGSLTPDFEYFLRMRIKSDYSHTIDGLFWFDLPLGILLTFLFHNIVKNCLIKNLPTVAKTRLLVFINFNWNNHFKSKWLIVLVSILIGAISHIFWDSFTHSGTFFVKRISTLQNYIYLFDRQIPFFKLLQHTSTLFGGLLIVFSVYKLPVNKVGKEDSKIPYWFVFALLTFIIIVIKLLVGLEFYKYGNVIVTIISAGLLSLLITPYVLNKIKIS